MKFVFQYFNFLSKSLLTDIACHLVVSLSSLLRVRPVQLERGALLTLEKVGLYFRPEGESGDSQPLWSFFQ